MIEAVSRRVKKLISALGMSERGISEVINVSNRTLNSSLKSERGLSLSIILPILSEFPDVSAEWLMRGNGEMFLNDDEKGKIVINNSNVKQSGNGNAIGTNNNNSVGTEALIAQLAKKDEMLAEKDRRINELTDTIIKLATK